MTDRLELEDLRRDYRKQRLDSESLGPDPATQFATWYAQATEGQVQEPNAMTLATVDTNGQPSARIVLLKFVDAEGFVFYTNYGSRKAHEIADNPRVALHFFWPELERQVRVRGVAQKVSTAESLRYFSRRPRESQLGAWVSHQSAPIPARSVLEKAFTQMKEKFAGGEVPLPDFWGGYRVRPEEVEFWQGGAHRLHDRFVYTRDGEGWRTQRLAP